MKRRLRHLGYTHIVAPCCLTTGKYESLLAPVKRVRAALLKCFPPFLHSVENLNKRLGDAKVVLVVGNGGIAMELVHSLVSKKACQVQLAIIGASSHGHIYLDV